MKNTSKPHSRALLPEDLPRVEAFLLRHLESSIFLLSNSRQTGLDEGESPFHGSYAGLFDSGDNPLGMAVHYRHGFLIVQNPDHPEDFESTWRLALANSGWPLRGVIGPSAQVGRILDQMQPSESDIQSDSMENLYGLRLDRLELSDPPEISDLTPRPAEPDDLPILVDWVVEFRGETLGDPDTPKERERSLHRVESQIEDGRLWVLQWKDRLVSMSAFNAKVPEAVQLGGVFTPPEFRSRGFSRVLVGFSLEAARNRGIGLAFLFTGRENIAAQRVYLALGFRQIGDYRICTFQPAA